MNYQKQEKGVSLVSEDCFECEVMHWDLFYDLARQVAKKVNNSGYKPDMIVGLARGGWVLARVLCDLIGIKDLVSLKVEHWGVTATPDGKAKLKYPLNVDLTKKNVLVVQNIFNPILSITMEEKIIEKLNTANMVAMRAMASLNKYFAIK